MGIRELVFLGKVCTKIKITRRVEMERSVKLGRIDFLYNRKSRRIDEVKVWMGISGLSESAFVVSLQS